MMAIELKPTAPIVAPKTVMNPAPTPVSTTSLIQRVPSIPYIADPFSLPMHLHSELSLQEQKEVCAITLSLTQEPSQRLAPHKKGKGKAKATEDDEDEEGEATQKFRKELEDFVIPTKISGGRKGDITLVSPAMRALVLEKNGAIAIIALLTIWLSTAGTQLVNVLAGTVIADPKAACGMA
ncbi:hypothetical protein C0995_007525 [Termitomyces sp. Mi166|nr:hypothetical protein C0995_007525 [Termitomyces sp. Mi166\